MQLPAIYAAQSSHPDNLMGKHFTDSYYFSLEKQQRKQLLQCCKSGYEVPAQVIGLYAMGPTDYEDHQPYFDKVCNSGSPSNC